MKSTTSNEFLASVSVTLTCQPFVVTNSTIEVSAVTRSHVTDTYVPILTQEQYLTATYILTFVKYSVLCVSFIVTVINVVVLMQKSMRTTMSVYVLCVSYAQVSYIAILVFAYILSARSSDPYVLFVYYVFSFYVVTYCGSVVTTSIFIVIVLRSVERLYAVVRPLHVKQFVLARLPLVFLLVTYVLLTVYHVYLPLQNRVVFSDNPDGSLAVYVTPTTVFVSHKVVIDSMSVWGKILFSYTPLLLLVIVNVLTLYFLRRHNVRRQAMKTTTDEEAAVRRERQMTTTILTATVIFVILSLPFAAHSILRSVVHEYTLNGKEGRFVWVMNEVCTVCTLLSNGADFLSFLLLSQSYRQTLYRLLHISRRQKTGPGPGRINSIV